MRLAARGSYTVSPTRSSGCGPKVTLGHFIVVARVLLQVRIEPGLHSNSKALCIEPRSTLTFGVSAPPRMRDMRHGFGLLSDHEMHDSARPGRRKYCCIPTVGLTIGEPCERRQQNERYTDNCRAGGRNARKKPGAPYEQITNQTRQRVSMEPNCRHVNRREKLLVSLERIGPQRHWTALIHVEQDFRSVADEWSNFRVERWQVRDLGRAKLTQAGIEWRILDAGMIWLIQQEPRRVT